MTTIGGRRGWRRAENDAPEVELILPSTWLTTRPVATCGASDDSRAGRREPSTKSSPGPWADSVTTRADRPGSRGRNAVPHCLPDSARKTSWTSRRSARSTGTRCSRPRAVPPAAPPPPPGAPGACARRAPVVAPSPPPALPPPPPRAPTAQDGESGDELPAAHNRRAPRSSPARSPRRVDRTVVKITNIPPRRDPPPHRPAQRRLRRRGPNRTRRPGRPPTTAERTPGGIAAATAPPLTVSPRRPRRSPVPEHRRTRRQAALSLCSDGRAGPRRRAPHRVPADRAPAPDDPREGPASGFCVGSCSSSPARQARRRPTAVPGRRPQLRGRCRRWVAGAASRTGFGGPLRVPVRVAEEPAPGAAAARRVGQFLGSAVPVQRRQDRALAPPRASPAPARPSRGPRPGAPVRRAPGRGARRTGAPGR